MKTERPRQRHSVAVRDSGQWRPFFSKPPEGAAIDEYNDLFMYRNYYKLVALDEQTNQVRGMDVNAVGNSEFRGGQVTRMEISGWPIIRTVLSGNDRAADQRHHPERSALLGRLGHGQ